MLPTLQGYITFLRNIVGISTTILPDNSPVIEWSYNFSTNTCTELLALVPNTPGNFLYITAVYNLATDTLLTNAHDQTGQTFFSEYQQKYQLRAFVPGVISSASDESTSSSMVVPKAAEGFTIQNLQNLKTPYGREYLAIVQSVGSLSLVSMA